MSTTGTKGAGIGAIYADRPARSRLKGAQMRAIIAEEFGGYQNLKLADIPKPAASDGRVLVRMTAAGVTPLDHTILSGGHPRAKAPLVLGNEGAGIVEEGGDEQFPDGSRVMFTGPYGVSENGAFSEWVAVKKEHLCLIPENIGDAAAGLPVAYLTAFLALRAAGFQPGKTVLSPAIGGSVGNAVTQLAKALGAQHAISTTTSHVKAGEAKKLGFSEVVDLSAEGMAGGVQRLTDGYGGRHNRGRYWWRHPERCARGLGAGWQSHHARLCGAPENDNRCDELDLDGCQHQKLRAVRSACICLGRSMDDDYRASQVGPGQADRR